MHRNTILILERGQRSSISTSLKMIYSDGTQWIMYMCIMCIIIHIHNKVDGGITFHI